MIKKYQTRVPNEYQEVDFIYNNYNQKTYIDTGFISSDLYDCEIEMIMRNDSTTTTAYNFNGAYESGKTSQFGLVATDNNTCRVSINFGFTDAVSVTGLSINSFHTIYVRSGLQKVDNVTVGSNVFGTLNSLPFLLFARTQIGAQDDKQYCPRQSIKLFTVRRNGEYIRYMLPVKRKSDNLAGLYDTANNIFYPNQGADTMSASTNIDNYVWKSIPYKVYENGEWVEYNDKKYDNGEWS